MHIFGLESPCAVAQRLVQFQQEGEALPGAGSQVALLGGGQGSWVTMSPPSATRPRTPPVSSEPALCCLRLMRCWDGGDEHRLAGLSPKSFLVTSKVSCQPGGGSMDRQRPHGEREWAGVQQGQLRVTAEGEHCSQGRRAPHSAPPWEEWLAL